MTWRASRRLMVALFAVAVGASPLRAEEPAAGQPSAKAAEALRLIDSEDGYQRSVGFLRLEALREPSTAALIRPYADNPNRDIRAQALRALAAIEGATSVPVLLAHLQRDKEARVRRAAVLGLEPLVPGDAAVLPALIDALRDRDAQVRMAAIDAVSRVDDARAREALLARKRREHQRDVRRVLRMALARIGS